MVRVRRKPRAKSAVGLQDFTAGDMARMRELAAEGLRSGWEPHPVWEKELEVLHHVRGRRRGMSQFLWQLDPYGYSVDDAVAEEVEHSVPGSLRTGRSKFCPDCEGLVHWQFHVVGDRYAEGCVG